MVRDPFQEKPSSGEAEPRAGEWLAPGCARYGTPGSSTPVAHLPQTGKTHRCKHPLERRRASKMATAARTNHRSAVSWTRASLSLYDGFKERMTTKASRSSDPINAISDLARPSGRDRVTYRQCQGVASPCGSLGRIAVAGPSAIAACPRSGTWDREWVRLYRMPSFFLWSRWGHCLRTGMDWRCPMAGDPPPPPNFPDCYEMPR